MFTRGCQYVAARSQPLDLLKSHFSDHRYEDAVGNLCGERFEFVHFAGAQSLRQVFDAVKFFMTNVEINISERLGHTTVREDCNGMDEATSIPNCRLVSETNDGVTFEMNSVAFAEYFEHREEFDGRPCAVMVADSVDVDDLYPYNPSERVRRDASVAIVFTEVKRRRRTGNAAESDDEELVVVMQRAAFSKVYCSELEVADASAMDALQEGVSNWGDVMVQTIRGFIQAL
ncbi:hypothetical protein BBJ28_00003216 [Nothophytophthora sp. Chile5]|nr:hypothetical protein BBJ28_00003216 [Nothophytophthora sp. Chile5]